MRRLAAPFTLVLLALSSAPEASAAPILEAAPATLSASEATSAARRRPPPRRAKKRPAPRPKKSEPVQVPIDVGFGAIGLLPTGPAFFDQPVHAGLMLSLAAVVDRKLIEQHKDRIPKQYRDQVAHVGEVRIRPLWLAVIPDVLVLSPAFLNTGMYGAIWRPFGLGVTLLDEPVRVSSHANLDLAYVFIHSTSIPQPTHFLRPGLNLDAVVEVPFTESFLMSFGWSSSFFPPQPLGGAPWEFLPVESSLWHLGGPFLKLHVRVPYEVSL